MDWHIIFPNTIVLAYFRLFCRTSIAFITVKLLGLPTDVVLWIVVGWYALKLLDWTLSYALHLLGSVAARTDNVALLLGLFRKRGFHVSPDCHGADCAAAMRLTCSDPSASEEDKLFAAELVGLMHGVMLGSFVHGRIAATSFNAAFDQYRSEYRASRRHDADYMRESAMHNILNTTR